jgi:UDP-glucose 4-epimerase
VVTGATGFLGRYVVQSVAKLPHAVVAALSRKATPIATVNARQLRVGDWEHLGPQFWRRHGASHVDVLIHLAAATPKRAREESARLCGQNVALTERLLNSLPSVPGTVVFASTIDVYGDPQRGAVVTEQTPLDPVGPYAEGKVACEKLCTDYARAGSSVSVLRYGHMYGPGEEAYDRLITRAIRRALAGEALELIGSGDVLRDYLHVRDAAEATRRIVMRPTYCAGVVNVVRGTSVSVESVLRILARISGRSIVRLGQESPVRSFTFDASKLREAAGTWRHVELEDGLREEFEYMRALRES